MTPLRIALLVLAALGAASASTQSPDGIARTVYSAFQRDALLVNNMVDSILAVTGQIFLVLGRDNVRMADITFDVDRFTVGLQNTKIGRMSTLQRTSDATVGMQANIVTISSSFGLRMLGMTSDLDIATKYGIPYINRKGNLDVTVDRNSLYMEASVKTTDRNCEIAVDFLEVREITGIKATATNFGILNPILNNIINKHLNPDEVGDKIQIELRKVMKQLRMPCPHLPALDVGHENNI